MHDKETRASRRKKGERKNVYFSSADLFRLQRLTLGDVGEGGISATVHEALVLLERTRVDYMDRLSKVIHTLALLPDMDEREQAIQELAALLDNGLAARGIAQALIDVVVQSTMAAQGQD
jgi:hypothetical protein